MWRGTRNPLQQCQFPTQATERRVVLTLDVVVDLAVRALRRELNLVSEDVAGSGGPVSRQAVVASNPLRADVGVNLHAVGVAVIGCRGDGVV